MTLLYDENLSPRLVRELDAVFPGSVHVHTVGLGSALDREIWSYAQQRGLVIVTKDEDFVELAMLRGAPPKVVLVRRGNATTDDLGRILAKSRSAIDELIVDPERVCLVLT